MIYTQKTAADSHTVVTISPFRRAGLEEDRREQCIRRFADLIGDARYREISRGNTSKAAVSR